MTRKTINSQRVKDAEALFALLSNVHELTLDQHMLSGANVASTTSFVTKINEINNFLDIVITEHPEQLKRDLNVQFNNFEQSGIKVVVWTSRRTHSGVAGGRPFPLNTMTVSLQGA